MRSQTLFAVILVVTALVLGGATYAGFQAYQNAVVDKHTTTVERNTALVRTELDAQLKTHEQSVELWATRPGVRAHGTARQRSSLRALVNNSAFAGASVIAANGTMTALAAPQSDAASVVGSDFGDRRYVQRALAGTTYISNPVPAETGTNVVVVSTPVRRDGDIVATLNGAVYLSETGAFDLLQSDLPDSSGVTVTTDGGADIYHRPPSPNRSVTTHTAPLSEADWVVSVSESRAVIGPTIQRLTLLQTGSVISVFAVIAVFGWWNYRRNLAQVEALIDGFRALRDGAYGTHVDVGGADEWERIGTGFNEMSDTIDQSVAENRERARQLHVLDRVLRHTLRNELNVVRGRAELVASHATGEAAAHAAHIISRCDSLVETADKERAISAVLDTDTTPEPLDVARITETVVERAQADAPNADLTVDTPPTAVAAAVPQIGTAIQEVVTNAIQHADCTAPQVSVSVSEPTATEGTDHVRITVSDHGPGIPRMERRVLNGDDAIDALHHSQGLGLWLVYWAVTHSDGDLDFEDNTPQGSVVTIRLPARDDTA
ncbi:sensor histidine kinase [Halobacterium salinarum]|uniref:sensor histidine kinase n=1 Tax=Halobacterium salinarum TaxID=2242 RepID=UPI0025579C93|nr:sensor histidine kinase [Halobacterium salinarum]MDL0136651.1 sensor histidine kinase [Halobacterium salinarum]